MIGLRKEMAGMVALLVAACGSGSGEGDGASEMAGGPLQTWAVDACKTFPATAAAQASGLPITRAELGTQTSIAGTNMTTCAYSTADGELPAFSVMLKQDTTESDTMDGQIESLQSEPDITGPTEVIPMPGGKAIWASRTKSLTYVTNDARMIVVTPPGLEFFKESAPDAEMKAAAVKIAGAVP